MQLVNKDKSSEGEVDNLKHSFALSISKSVLEEPRCLHRAVTVHVRPVVFHPVRLNSAHLLLAGSHLLGVLLTLRLLVFLCKFIVLLILLRFHIVPFGVNAASPGLVGADNDVSGAG
jgi:hypothetical protein